MIEVDGSYLEGGGQTLRTALSFSAITKKPCFVFNIRKKRPKPGLATQHLLSIRGLAKLTDGKLEGDFLGSEEVKFYPKEIGTKNLQVKIETAGSITLVLQALILPSLFSPLPVKIIFEGGATDTFFSPTIDYFQYVFLKFLEKIGGEIDLKIEKRGYYPAGGARIEIIVHPKKLKSLKLTERGRFLKITAISGASEFLKNKKVAERQLTGVKEVLSKLKLPLEEKIEYYQTDCPGSQICLIAEFENTIIGADNLGKLKKSAEDIGKETALNLLREQKSEACLDKYLADQFLPYLALAEGKSQITFSENTDHLKTNIWVIEKFIDKKIEIERNLITLRNF